MAEKYLPDVKKFFGTVYASCVIPVMVFCNTY